MKKLKPVLVFCLFLVNFICYSQNFQLNVSSSLTYKFTEFDKPIGYTFTIDSISPNLTYEWDNSNKEDNFGVGIVMQDALNGAINLTFYYSSTHSIVMYDRLPSFIVSKKMYNELKIIGKTRIRLQDYDNTNVLEVIGEEGFEIMVNKELQEVNVIHAKFSDGMGWEIWILDNPEMPLVTKLKAERVYELKYIDN